MAPRQEGSSSAGSSVTKRLPNKSAAHLTPPLPPPSAGEATTIKGGCLRRTKESQSPPPPALSSRAGRNLAREPLEARRPTVVCAPLGGSPCFDLIARKPAEARRNKRPQRGSASGISRAGATHTTAWRIGLAGGMDRQPRSFLNAKANFKRARHFHAIEAANTPG